MIKILLHLVSLWVIVIALRNFKRVLFRFYIKRNIKKKLAYLVKKEILEYHPDEIFPYTGVLGSEQPLTVKVMQAGVHGGLEMLPIEMLLDSLIHDLDIESLKRNHIQLIVIPIVNYWGFEHYRRVNRWWVDLVRNSGYRTQHENQHVFVKGWRGMKNKYIWFFALIAWKTWYWKGIRIQEETQTLLDLLNPLSVLYGSNLHSFDFHTGNTSEKTHTWSQELYRSNYLPQYITEACDLQGVIYEKVDYGTNGGIYEKIAFDTANHDYIGLTVEFSVTDYYSDLHYSIRYFFGTVFEPSFNIYLKKKEEGRVFISKLIMEYKEHV